MSHAQRIALPMTEDSGFNRQPLLGVRAFAVARSERRMHAAPPKSASLSPLRAWQPHGIIAHLPDRNDLKAQEPPDPPPGRHARNWSLMNRLNMKGVRAQDTPRPLAQLEKEEREIIGRRYPQLFAG
jgi:hypothetical protein